MGQDFRKGLARWFWFRISHEVTIKILVKIQSSEDMRKDPLSRWLIHRPLAEASSSCLLLAGCFCLFSHEPPHKTVCVSTTWQIPPTENDSTRRRLQCISWCSLGSHTLLFCHILFVMSESLSPAHVQGKGISTTFWRKKYAIICVHILKPP